MLNTWGSILFTSFPCNLRYFHTSFLLFPFDCNRSMIDIDMENRHFKYVWRYITVGSNLCIWYYDTVVEMIVFTCRVCGCHGFNATRDRSYKFFSSTLTLWATALKIVKHTQTIRRKLPTSCFSEFDQFVELTLKGLKQHVVYAKSLKLRLMIQGYGNKMTGRSLGR